MDAVFSDDEFLSELKLKLSKKQKLKQATSGKEQTSSEIGS
jgi:hypothetical protein